MRNKPIIILLALSVSISLSGCANYMMIKASEDVRTKVTNLGYVFDSKPSNCPIEVFNKTKPTKDYMEIAKLESHFAINAMTTSLTEEINTELVKQACLVGGDAVIVNESIETSNSEHLSPHMWSTVIRYR